MPWGGPGEFRRQVGVTFSDLLGKDASIRVEDRSVAIPLIQPVDREKERVYRQRGLRKGKKPPAKVAPIHALESCNRQQENPTSDGNVDRLFKSLLPDVAANEFSAICRVFSVIAAKIRSDLPAADISEVMDQVSTLLDYSISTQGYVIKPSATTANYIDLSQIDFETLRAKFDKGRKATEAQKLRGAIALKLTRMVHLNRTRIDFLQEFQKMIDEYNSGTANMEAWFAKLTAFAQKLSDDLSRCCRLHDALFMWSRVFSGSHY